MAKGPYLGLRGTRLVNFQLMTIVLPAYFLLGYNNAVMGGLLSLDSFIETFPQTNTGKSAGSAATENAKIQGES